jgi:hypothetical protein
MYRRWMDWSRRIHRGYLGMMGLSRRLFVSSSVSNQIMSEVEVSSQTSSSSATMARPSDKRTPIPVRSLLQRSFLNPQPPLAAMGLCKEGSGMPSFEKNLVVPVSTSGISCLPSSSFLAMAPESGVDHNARLSPGVVPACTIEFPRPEGLSDVVVEVLQAVELVSSSLPIPKPVKCYNRKLRDNKFLNLDDCLIVETVSAFSAPPVSSDAVLSKVTPVGLDKEIGLVQSQK